MKKIDPKSLVPLAMIIFVVFIIPSFFMKGGDEVFADVSEVIRETKNIEIAIDKQYYNIGYKAKGQLVDVRLKKNTAQMEVYLNNQIVTRKLGTKNKDAVFERVIEDIHFIKFTAQ